MILSRYVKDRGAALNALDKISTIALGSVILNFILLWAALSNHERFTTTPFKLDQRATLAYSSMSKEYHEKYGLSFSVLLGNLKPSTVQTSMDSVLKMFTPSLARLMNKQLQAQVDKIASAGVTLTFWPDKIEFESSTGKTFVTGIQTATTIQGEPKEKTVTYEYKLIVDEYIPWVSHFDFYDGAARNTHWISKNKNILDMEARNRAEKAKAENEL